MTHRFKPKRDPKRDERPETGIRHNSRFAYKDGVKGEKLAILFLLLKGYRIKSRRFKTRLGEIDIIAQKKDTVAFIEVKALNTVAKALDRITYASQKRIESAAELWLRGQKDAGRLSWRFDVIAVLPYRWPVHIQDVW